MVRDPSARLCHAWPIALASAASKCGLPRPPAPGADQLSRILPPRLPPTPPARPPSAELHHQHHQVRSITLRPSATAPSESQISDHIFYRSGMMEDPVKRDEDARIHLRSTKVKADAL
jgi:hypothetical protein